MRFPFRQWIAPLGDRFLQGGECAIGGDAVRQDVFATPLHAGISGICAQFGQEDDLPDGAAIFGRIAAARLHPVAFGMLSVKDDRHGAAVHDGGFGLLHLGVIRRSVQQVGEGEITDGGVGRVRFQQPG